ncbi:MAG TPA: GNAT family N-acetyltransferase [Clostridiales bacterium]|nr:GNAT family N-acetyltransferase [Clostridiales bacterium]
MKCAPLFDMVVSLSIRRCHMNETPCKERLETPRLLLRKGMLSDWESLWRNVWSRPEAARYMLWSVTESAEEARARMARTIEWEKTHPWKYCVEEKASGRVIGWAGVEPLREGVWGETGIALGPDYWRRGYGREILETLCELCRGMGAKRFVAAAREENFASNALIRERGFFFDRSEERVDERNGESYFMNWYHRDLNGN